VCSASNPSSSQAVATASPTDVGILEISGVLRDPSVGKPSLIRPFVCVFGLPRPLNPPRAALLVRNDLCLPVLAEEGLVARAERRRTAGEALAAADRGRTRVRTVVSGANATTVQVLSAVRRGGGPLANDKPEVETREGRRLGTGGRYVLLVSPGDFLLKFRMSRWLHTRGSVIILTSCENI
jgi:hypothetical protein